MDKNETIHERITQLVNVFGQGKNTVFASLIGSNEANIRGYRTSVIPKFDFLEKIARSIDVDLKWLLTGEGSMLKEKQVEEKTTTDVVDASYIYDMYKDYKNMQAEKDTKIDTLNTEIKELQVENKALTKELTELKLKIQKQESYIEKLVRALEHYENAGTIQDFSMGQVPHVGDVPFGESSFMTSPPSAHANVRLGKGKSNK